MGWGRVRRRFIFDGARCLVRLLGFEAAKQWGALIGTAQFHLSRATRARCERDMRALFATRATPRDVRAWLKEGHRVNTAAVLQVLALLERPVPASELERHCDLLGQERLVQALARGRGAVLLAMHAGNSLLAAIRLAQAGHSVSVVYHQPHMMTVDRFAEGLPSYGIVAIRANGGLAALARIVSALRRGGLVFLMLDQGAETGDGIDLRFLGKTMPMQIGAAKAATTARAPVVPLIARGAWPRWSFEFGQAIDLPGASVEQDTASLLSLCEREILARPDLWSWHQRRWREFPMDIGG